jgi:hypothetical protein
MGDEKRPVPDAVERLTFRVRPRESRAVRVVRRQKNALVLDRFGNVCDSSGRTGQPDLPESSAPLVRNAMGALESAVPAVCTGRRMRGFAWCSAGTAP